jgi:hypothetical protein
MKIDRDRVEAVDRDEELGQVCELALVVADARPWPCARPGPSEDAKGRDWPSGPEPALIRHPAPQLAERLV